MPSNGQSPNPTIKGACRECGEIADYVGHAKDFTPTQPLLGKVVVHPDDSMLISECCGAFVTPVE